MGVINMKPGSNTKEGFTYHDLPGSGLPSQRLGTEARASFILEKIGDVKGKRIVDIGCSVGGISYFLGKAGAKVRGFDYDRNAIQIGREYLQGKDLEVSLTTCDVDPIFIQRMGGWGEYDIAVWLSHWMWFVKQ